MHLRRQTFKMRLARSRFSLPLTQPAWTAEDCNGPHIALGGFVPPFLLSGRPHLGLAARLARERHVDVEAPGNKSRCAIAIGGPKVCRIDENLTLELRRALFGCARRLPASLFRASGGLLVRAMGADFLSALTTTLHRGRGLNKMVSCNRAARPLHDRGLRAGGVRSGINASDRHSFGCGGSARRPFLNESGTLHLALDKALRQFMAPVGLSDRTFMRRCSPRGLRGKPACARGSPSAAVRPIQLGVRGAACLR